MKLRLVILTVILLGWTAPASAQACAMCYSSAQATPKDGQRAINKGVIVLLVPPVGFMTLGLWMAERYARKRDLEQHESEEFATLAITHDSQSVTPPALSGVEGNGVRGVRNPDGEGALW